MGGQGAGPVDEGRKVGRRCKMTLEESAASGLLYSSSHRVRPDARRDPAGKRQREIAGAHGLRFALSDGTFPGNIPDPSLNPAPSNWTGTDMDSEQHRPIQAFIIYLPGPNFQRFRRLFEAWTAELQ